MAQEMAAEIPPSERPILRQPLGFSIDQPAKSINTYEASLSGPVQSGVFLPGQEVPSSPKLKFLKGKKRSCAKRPRRPEAFAGQTSRFRLETFEPTPGGDSSTHIRSGPYPPMYRGVAPTTGTRLDLPATVATASLQNRASNSTASSNAMVSFGRFPSLHSSQENSSASKGKSTQPASISPFSCSKFQQFTSDIGSSSLGGTYYRHNYESQHRNATSLLPSQRPPAQSETQKWARSQGYPPAASTSSRGTDNEEAEGLELNHILEYVWLCFSHLLLF